MACLDPEINVVLVSTLYPNDVMPTRGIFTAHIAQSLKLYCNVIVISPLPWFPKNKIFSRFEKWNQFSLIPGQDTIDGIEIYYPRYLVIPKIGTFLHSIFIFFPLYFLIRRLKNQGKVDLIKTHWIFPDGVASTLVAKFLKIPQVLVALGCDITHFPSLPFRKRQISWSLKNANVVMAVSEDLVTRVKSLGACPDQVFLAPDGVDFDIFHIRDKKKCRQEIGIPQDAIVILQVASLDEVKATHLLIRAVAKLTVRINRKLLVYIIGEGPLKSGLVELAQKLGVQKNIFFIGRKPHSKVAKWMNAADVFCLTSLREGRPNVIIESLASGTTVVATAVGGVPELINPENGYLAKPADSTSIADNLYEALTSARDPRQVANTVAHFTWEAAGKIYFKKIAQILKR